MSIANEYLSNESQLKLHAFRLVCVYCEPFRTHNAWKNSATNRNMFIDTISRSNEEPLVEINRPFIDNISERENSASFSEKFREKISRRCSHLFNLLLWALRTGCVARFMRPISGSNQNNLFSQSFHLSRIPKSVRVAPRSACTLGISASFNGSFARMGFIACYD